MKPLVSVIVPVYKAEDCLERCLGSLCRQSLRAIEIILVDDASPDRSGEICEQYAAEDGRVRVFHHTENRGLSATRNTGIAHASAEYLMFADSDDWAHEDFCKLPYEYAVQHQADLVMFRYKRMEKDGSARAIMKTECVSSGQLNRLEAIELLLHSSIGTFPWNKLYSRRLFNNISYPEGYIYEGTGTVYKTVLLADTVFYLDKVLYYYCYHEGSVTTLKTEKALQDWYVMSLQQYRDLSAWGYPMDKAELMLRNIALTYCVRKKPDMADADYVFCRKQLLSAKKIPEGFTWKRKVLFVLLEYCPMLFDMVCTLCGKRW